MWVTSHRICAHLPGLVQDAQDERANVQGRAIVDLRRRAEEAEESHSATVQSKRRLRKDPVQVRLVVVVWNLPTNTSPAGASSAPSASEASKKSRNIWLPCSAQANNASVGSSFGAVVGGL